MYVVQTLYDFALVLPLHVAASIQLIKTKDREFPHFSTSPDKSHPKKASDQFSQVAPD